MKAITIVPGTPNSVSVQDVPEPSASDGAVLVRALELGICGTDFELISAEYGWPPRGSDHLILGHESLGVVEEAPGNSAFQKGDLVVGIVRHPDPVPCVACAVDEWDMCRNGKYTERGIKEINGFGAELWRSDPGFVVKLDPKLSDRGVLMEPTTILAKAWDHIAHIGQRALWEPKTVLVTGAGPVGLLAALIGAQRGLEVHVLDRVTSGPKPQLVQDLGGKYHTGPLDKLGFSPDVIIECTGVASVIVEAINLLGNDGILCLAGVSSHGQQQTLDIGKINRTMVLENSVIFGTVNANRKHYRMAAEVLAKADPNWLARMISRREPLSNWQKAFERHPDDIKVVIDFNHR
jgi:threonine dehydrogenase-like Zn-dependent dehydrogenase